MSHLLDRLRRQIRASGPISVSEYMTLCLHDPTDGYYATRPGLGTDFITAPETSQLFGEMLGLWLAYEWRNMGSPGFFYLVEAGPGRGTLMQDALRAARFTPGLIDAMQLYLIEASPALKAVQGDALNAYAPLFIDDIDALPPGVPVILLANEWLDCLPANQFARSGDSWYERVIGLDEDDHLTFGLAAQPLQGDFSHLNAYTQVEVQPALTTLVESLGAKFANADGRALLIDYGPSEAMPEDSLRAYKKGSQIHPLEGAGLCDLTVDVDFARLKHLAEAAKLAVDGPIPQGLFLQTLGIEARLNDLAKSNPGHAQNLFEGAQKLVDPDAMGARFKAICLSSSGLPKSAGF